MIEIVKWWSKEQKKWIWGFLDKGIFYPFSESFIYTRDAYRMMLDTQHITSGFFEKDEWYPGGPDYTPTHEPIVSLDEYLEEAPVGRMFKDD